MNKAKMVLQVWRIAVVSHTKGNPQDCAKAPISTLRFRQTSLCRGLRPVGWTVCTTVIGLIKTLYYHALPPSAPRTTLAQSQVQTAQQHSSCAPETNSKWTPFPHLNKSPKLPGLSFPDYFLLLKSIFSQLRSSNHAVFAWACACLYELQPQNAQHALRCHSKEDFLSLTVVSTSTPRKQLLSLPAVTQ